MNELEYWKQANKHGYQKAIARKELLHKNTKELVALIDVTIKQKPKTIMEVGCGAGRNLYYLMKLYHPDKIIGTDLDEAECFKYMEKDLKERIIFLSIDSAELFTKNTFIVDLLLFSDHLMHLPPKSIDSILAGLLSRWRFRYLVIRDTDVPRERPPIKYAHDFTILDDKLNKLLDRRSKHVGEYFIRIYERKAQ